MKLEAGQFVRTKDGEIHKIKSINDEYIEYENGFGVPYELKDIIIKASFNIIDLIETRDILLLFDKDYGEKYKAEVVIDRENFKSVINYEQDTLLNLEYELITNEHIELLEILTKEQFEKTSYKLGE